MKCQNCGSKMNLEEVLTHRTTSPDEDDQYQDMFVCSNGECGHTEPAEEGTHDSY